MATVTVQSFVCWTTSYTYSTIKKNKYFITYHSLCYLPGEGHHVLWGYRIIFIVTFILFFIIQGLNVFNSYVNAAVRFREGDVDLANVIYTRSTILQVV